MAEKISNRMYKADLPSDGQQIEKMTQEDNDLLNEVDHIDMSTPIDVDVNLSN